MLEILAGLIAFVAAILLLSIFVTAGAQFTQSVLRLRGRTLRRGLTDLIPALTSIDDPKEAKRTARRICEAPPVDPTRAVAVPGKERFRDPVLNAVSSGLLGTSRSWIEPDELTEAMRELGVAHPKDKSKPGTELEMEKLKRDTEAKVKRAIPRLERETRRRFAFRMRIVAVVWAAIIAVAYQVSTPDLIARLARDPAAREEGLRVAREALHDIETNGPLQIAYTDVSANALELLATRHPELRETLEEASGRAQNPDEALRELRLVLEKHPSDQGPILREYADILDSETTKRDESAKASAVQASAYLGRLEITLWKEGRAFFLKDGSLQWNHLLGILMTIVLLTFGAPFWYEALKRLVGLRDLLAPVKDKKELERQRELEREKAPEPA